MPLTLDRTPAIGSAPAAPVWQSHFLAGSRAGYNYAPSEELYAMAERFDLARRIRAAERLLRYRLVTPDGLLEKLSTGECYACEDVRRWKDRPGLVAYIGCNCLDEERRLRPLRAVLLERGIGAPHCFCQHHYVRNLYAGRRVAIGGYRVKAAAHLLQA
jgi:hypothetical protein